MRWGNSRRWGNAQVRRSTGATLHDTAAAFLATRDAAKDAAKSKVVHLGREYDLAEGDEGYRLVPTEGYFDDKGYF